MNVDRLVFFGIVLLTLIRWGLTTTMELTETEALYWMASQQVEWFTLDHGPCLPVLISASTWALGDTVFAVRYWNPLLIFFATSFLYLLARSVWHQTAARWAVVVFQLCPITTMAAVFLPQVAISLCLGLMGLWCVWCGLHRAHPWHVAWIGAAVAFGLAMTVHLAMVLVHLVSLGAVLSVRRWEGHWRRPGLWIVLFGAVVVALLFVLRGAHGFSGTLRSRGWQPLAMTQGLLAWAWWTGPLFCWGWVWLWRHHRRGFGTGARWLSRATLWMTGLGVIWTLMLSPAAPVLAMVTALGVLVLAGEWHGLPQSPEWKGLWRRRGLLSSGALALALACPGFWLLRGAPWPAEEVLARPGLGWEESAEAVGVVVRQDAASEGSGGMLVIAATPGEAALLDFYLADDLPIHRPDPRAPRIHVVESAGLESLYDLWPDYSHAGEGEHSPFLHRTALYVTSEEDVEALPANLRDAFKSHELAALLEIKRRDHLLHRWYFYHFYHYQGLPL